MKRIPDFRSRVMLYPLSLRRYIKRLIVLIKQSELDIILKYRKNWLAKILYLQEFAMIDSMQGN